ncbi:unnamed protein product [Calicophoron daubneyi]|uniref:Craniofacial development protein 1 n=1 Tax=Calicophoron daubneyi TaxID=300641 RepID=A0AAV2TZ39_CALDB
MNSDEYSSSSSDEEYVPPAKLSSDGEDSDTSVSGDECESEDNSEEVPSKRRRNNSDTKGVNNDNNSIGLDDKKAKEDKIWDEFLSSVEQPVVSRAPSQPVTVVRTYRFAGEDLKVTEKVNPSEAVPEAPVKHSSAAPGTSTTQIKSDFSSMASSISLNSKSNLSKALQNLKTLGSKQPPKLTTLEKSRLDWQAFVQKEDIEDDLRAYNKGKQGYLERRAFVDRAKEREYEIQKSHTKRKL